MKEKIIQKAADLFLTVGFKSITMDDIAAEMGISKKTIYKYFANKEILVEEASCMVHNKVRSQIDAIVSQNHNPIKENFEIRRTIKGIFETSDKSPLYQLKKHYPEVHEKLMSREMADCECVFRQNIEKGIAQGLYRENVDVETNMKFYYTLIFHISETTALEKDIHRLELALLEYHTRAIATEKGIAELERQLTNPNI